MKFRLGQIVVPNFTGISRYMYELDEDGPSQIKYDQLDNTLNTNDIGVIIDTYHETDSSFTWIKLLTSTGRVGYVPPIWIKIV